MRYTITGKTKNDYGEVLGIIRGWGSDIIVSRGKVHSADTDGLIARVGESTAGLCLYAMANGECEIVLLEVFHKKSGIGSALIEELKKIAQGGCGRLWLITTNDNIDAIRFYQMKGFSIAAVYPGAIAESRRIKPEIPYTGNYGIPIRDEIEFEMKF